MCTTTLRSSGSAPIAANVKDFLRVALNVKFVEGYGLSETAAAASICHPEDVSNHHVGMPSMCCEIKLQDCPEMSYASSNALPTGEVCVRGPWSKKTDGWRTFTRRKKETVAQLQARIDASVRVHEVSAAPVGLSLLIPNRYPRSLALT